MPDTLHLSPQGHLLLSNAAADPAASNDPKRAKLLRAFERSTAEGLFTLAVEPGAVGLDEPELAFWRDLATRFLQALCRAAATEDPFASLERPSEPDLAFLALAAPPMTGAEYLGPPTLAALWDDLRDWTRDAVAHSGLTLAEWLRKKAPQWHQLGRVCFHLADNKNDRDFPFAFMATYAPRLSQSGRVQFLPLGNALKEYAGAQNKRLLVQLLEPVHEASKKLPFVAALLESGDLYHPLAWTPAEAYALLKSIPQLEESGLLTRLPNWWQARARPAVAVSIGEKTKGGVGMGAMLSFRVEVALGNQRLDPAEIESLLQQTEGLVRLNGQWVEVDREKLQQALDHWRRVEAHAADGAITFAEGMRLLAGANRNLRGAGPGELDLDAARDWSIVHAGGDFAETLAKLRDPQRLGNDQPVPGLRGQLRPYQQRGYSWLRFVTELRLGACLADDMGLGKTIQVIALLLSLKQQPATPPSLLVLPASLLGNWKSEFATFAPTLRLGFVHPSEPDQANPTSLSQTDVVLTTYGMLLRHEWLLQTEWNLVVIDEAQAIKNPSSSQTRAVKRLQARSRIALTGTPIENKLGDLWSIFDFACPGLLGSANLFSTFAKSLKDGQNGGYAALRKLVSPYILRRLKTDKSVISDLPDKTELKTYCLLAPKQAALYQRSVEELKTRLAEAEGMERRGLVLTFLMRFKQICNHPSQALGDNEYSPEASGKFARLAELCEEIAARQEKVLVFTQFREMIAPLDAFLASLFGRKGLVLHGGTPVAQRKKLVDAFQAEDGPPYFALSLKAGGSGLNLTAASHVIHFDRWWNPAVENQATDRAFRIGQKRNVLVHKFVARGTIEEKVDRLIHDKLALSDSLLENGSETNFTELSDAELLDLVALDLNAAL